MYRKRRYIEVDYYNTITLDHNKREPRRKYMTLTQRKEVVADTNEIALYLLEFYYTKAHVPEYDYTDEKVARALDWTERKVKDNRLKLEKAHYFTKKVIRSRDDCQTRFTLGHIRWKIATKTK